MPSEGGGVSQFLKTLQGVGQGLALSHICAPLPQTCKFDVYSFNVQHVLRHVLF